MNFKNITFDEKKEFYKKIFNHICYIIATENYFSLERSTIELLKELGLELNENEIEILFNLIESENTEIMAKVENI